MTRELKLGTLDKIFGTAPIRNAFERAIINNDYECALHLVEANYTKLNWSKKDLDRIERGLNDYQFRLVILKERLK
jgi:hypothetical protein